MNPRETTKTRSMRHYITVPLCLLTAGALVAGCSGASPKGNPKGGSDTLTIAQSTDPVSMNPLEQRVTSTYSVLRNLYDPLVDFTSATDYKLAPVLATSWKQVNPTQLQLQLRTGVKFQDGSPFDSASVVYTVQALLGQLPGSKKALASFLFPTLTKAAADGPNTVDLFTSAPTPQLLQALTQLLIIPNNSLSAGNKLATTPNGTGPYEFVSYTPNQQIVMNAKSDYFLGAAAIKKIVWKTIPTPTSQMAALQAGDIDLAFGLLPSQVKAVQQNPRTKVSTVASSRVAAVWLDTLSNQYLKNPKVRLALNYAVDRDAIVKSTLLGLGEPLANLVPSFFNGFDSSLKPFPYDPDKAKQLLAEAGYPDGFPLTIMVPSDHYVLGPEITQVVASELGQVGVKVKIQQVAFSDFATLTAQRKIPGAFYGAWGSNYPDPEVMFQTIIQSGDKGFSWYSNPAVDTLITKASTELDQTTYSDALKSIQQAIYADPPFIFLFAYKDAWGMSKSLNWNPPSTEVEYMYQASWAK